MSVFIKEEIEMNIALALIAIFTSWRFGKWSRFRDYHLTMLFLTATDLIYNFITHSTGYFLWRMPREFFLNGIMIELLWMLIILPAAVLLFLSYYPGVLRYKLLYILGWTQFYTTLEWFFHRYGRIQYFHGWGVWQSFVFYIIMFTGIRLFYRKPVVGYLVFIIVTLFGIWGYRVPILMAK